MPTTTNAEKPPARTAICIIYFPVKIQITNQSRRQWIVKGTTCNASLADRLAALETLTFARTDTHIPT
jgi:hypothetical protein